MRLTKNQLKTWNSQQSDIDMFSKIESSFLQKFFRLNLIDHFEDIVANLYEVHEDKKSLSKQHRTLFNYLFKVEKSFMIHELEQKIHSFYKQRAKSFESGQLQHIFKTRYCNWNPVPNMFKKGQIIMVDVKIKAQIQRLETIPLKLIETLETTCKQNINQAENELLKQTFRQYAGQYINIFVVYFGDINFHVVQKKNYEQQSITLYGKKIKLRIFAFFISKQALLQTFKAMNNITSIDHINDLAIQYYEVKREKRKLRKDAKKAEQEKRDRMVGEISLFGRFKSQFMQKIPDNVKMLVAGSIGVVVVCLMGYKWLGQEKTVQKV